MDAALLLICISSFVGLIMQARFSNDDAITWLTVTLASGGIVMALESGLNTTATIILTISQFIVWIYSILRIFKTLGGDV